MRPKPESQTKTCSVIFSCCVVHTSDTIKYNQVADDTFCVTLETHKVTNAHLCLPVPLNLEEQVHRSCYISRQKQRPERKPTWDSYPLTSPCLPRNVCVATRATDRHSRVPITTPQSPFNYRWGVRIGRETQPSFFVSQDAHTHMCLHTAPHRRWEINSLNNPGSSPELL